MSAHDFYAADPDIGGTRQVFDDDLLHHRPDEDEVSDEPRWATLTKNVVLIAAVVALLAAVLVVATVRAGGLQ